jgi:hypothetical protein
MTFLSLSLVGLISNLGGLAYAALAISRLLLD